MATQLKDVPKNIAIRDVFHTAPRASAVGAAGMRELETVAEIKAEAAALYYRATGIVARDVPEELRDEAYDIQRGRRSPVAAVDRLCTILRHRVTVRRTLTQSEAHKYAAQMLELCRQLIEMKLPVSPDPTPGHTVQPFRSATNRDGCAHRGVGGDSVLGSDPSDYRPRRSAA